MDKRTKDNIANALENRLKVDYALNYILSHYGKSVIDTAIETYYAHESEKVWDKILESELKYMNLHQLETISEYLSGYMKDIYEE